MIGSFNGVTVRGMRTHKLRSALTGLGVVLGVGMVFGVLILVGTIHQTFTQLINSAYGSRSLIVSARSGGTLPDSSLGIIRATPGVKSTGQAIGGSFIRLDARGRPIHGSAGVMWVAGFDMNESPYDFQLLHGRGMRSGPEVALEQNWARDHHLRVGDSLAVAAPTGRLVLHVVGIFGFSSGIGFGGQGLAGVPLAYARRVMNQPSGWNDVSITTTSTDKKTVAAVQRRLQRSLGRGILVQAPSGLEKQAASQLQALNVVLYFFSGVALFVGGFLILNSFNMTVLQRMREIGLLRTLGASPRMIAGSVLIEALIVGGTGTALGLGLGFGLAQGLVSAMKGMGMPIGSIPRASAVGERERRQPATPDHVRDPHAVDQEGRSRRGLRRHHGASASKRSATSKARESSSARGGPAHPMCTSGARLRARSADSAQAAGTRKVRATRSGARRWDRAATPCARGRGRTRCRRTR